jgi:hypothetical protein
MPPLVVEMLQAIEKVFAEQEIDCYIVGALARDLQLAKIRGHYLSRYRLSRIDSYIGLTSLSQPRFIFYLIGVVLLLLYRQL